MIVRICFDMGGIHDYIFSANQTYVLALLNNPLKYLPKYILPMKPATAVLGERRMIRNRIIQIQSQIPPVSNIVPDFLLQLPLGVNAIEVSQQQHLHQQYWVYGRPATVTIQRSHKVIYKVETNCCI